MIATATEIQHAYERAFPEARWLPLTFDVLVAQEERDRRAHLAELGAEALQEEPIARRLDAIARRLRRRMLDLGAPVSLAEAARQLHISKGRTLLPAIAAGNVRTVRVGGRLKIPLDELERLSIEGVTPRRPRAPKAGHPARSRPRDLGVELAEVRALRFPSRG